MDLAEAFDQPLPYARNKEEERIYQKAFYEAGIRYFEIYSSKLGKDDINFYLFLNRESQYEIHFSNSANSHEIVALNIYKNNQLTRIIATAIRLAVEKLKMKTNPFLLYGDTERKTKLYIRAIQSKFPNLHVKEVHQIKGVDGHTYPYGAIIKPDTRSFKLENILRY